METSNDFCSRLQRTDKFGLRDATRGLTGHASLSTSVPFLFLSYQHPYEWLFLLLKFIDLSELISRPSCSFHNKPERRRRRRRRELNRKRCNFGAVCRTGRGWITAGLSRIECLFDDLINYLGMGNAEAFYRHHAENKVLLCSWMPWMESFFHCSIPPQHPSNIYDLRNVQLVLFHLFNYHRKQIHVLSGQIFGSE